MIVQGIKRTLEECQLDEIAVLAVSDYDLYLGRIIQLFTGQDYQYPLWDNIREAKSVRDSNGWMRISEMVGKSRCILLTEPHDGKIALSIPNGAVLKTFLEQMFGFVFYITNNDCGYVLCFNDHDLVLGAGDVEETFRRFYAS